MPNILPINRNWRNRYQFLRKLCVGVNESTRTYVKLLADESMHIVWREWIDFECFYMPNECKVNAHTSRNNVLERLRRYVCDCVIRFRNEWTIVAVPLQHSPNDYSIDIYVGALLLLLPIIMSQCNYRIHKHNHFRAEQLQARGGCQQRKSLRSINY